MLEFFWEADIHPTLTALGKFHFSFINAVILLSVAKDMVMTRSFTLFRMTKHY